MKTLKNGLDHKDIIMRNRSLFRLACLMVAFATITFADAAARQPNVVVLFADDLGYGELSCQGNPEIPTPHIDSIAKNGVRFTAGYVAGPNCSPSRAGLLTGRTPTRFGYEFNPTGALNEEPGFGLPSNEITIAAALARHRQHLAEWIEATGDPGSETPEVYRLETEDQMKATRNKASREAYRENAELYKRWAREGK